MRKFYKKLKRNYYSKKLNKSVSQKFSSDGTNIVNRLYQVNGNNRVFRNNFKTKSKKFESALQKSLYKEVSKPTGMNFQITFNTFRNRDIVILNTDSYFTFNDFKMDEATSTALAAETSNRAGIDAYLPLDQETRYKSYMQSMLPTNQDIDSLKTAKVADSVINPAFYPQSIIINPTIAAVCWGWIFRVNPAILRFDYSLFSFYCKLFNFINTPIYTKYSPIITLTGAIANAATVKQTFMTSRKYRIICARNYFDAISTGTKRQIPVPSDYLDDSYDTVAAIDSLTALKNYLLGLPAGRNDNVIANGLAALLADRPGVNGVAAPLAGAALNAFATSFNFFLNQFENAPNAAATETEKCWRAIFNFSSDSVYFVMLYFDMMAFCLRYGAIWNVDPLAPVTNPEDVSTFPIMTSFLQNNKFLTGRVLSADVEAQYYFTYSDLLSNGFLKVYPCNMMVGKDWKIKSKKANAVVFFVPNDDVKQTVNFVYSLNCSLYSFKKFILESSDSRRFNAFTPGLKDYIKKMLPNIEKYFVVKDANAKIVKDRIERMLNTLNRK